VKWPDFTSLAHMTKSNMLVEALGGTNESTTDFSSPLIVDLQPLCNRAPVLIPTSIRTGNTLTLCSAHQAVVESDRASMSLHRIQLVMISFLANGRLRWYDDAGFKFEDT